MEGALILFVGAGLGGALRPGVNVACARTFGTSFAWGTPSLDVLGALGMWALVGWRAFKAEQGWNQPLRLFLTTAILGGFSTFSAFSLDPCCHRKGATHFRLWAMSRSRSFSPSRAWCWALLS